MTPRKTYWPCEKAGTGLANGKQGLYLDGMHAAGPMRVALAPSMVTPQCFGFHATVDGAQHVNGAVIDSSDSLEASAQAAWDYCETKQHAPGKSETNRVITLTP